MTAGPGSPGRSSLGVNFPRPSPRPMTAAGRCQPPRRSRLGGPGCSTPARRRGATAPTALPRSSPWSSRAAHVPLVRGCGRPRPLPAPRPDRRRRRRRGLRQGRPAARPALSGRARHFGARRGRHPARLLSALPRAWLGAGFKKTSASRDSRQRCRPHRRRGARDAGPAAGTEAGGAPHLEATVAEWAPGFQDSVVDVLATKTIRAGREPGARAIVAGGVSRRTPPCAPGSTMPQRPAQASASRGLGLVQHQRKDDRRRRRPAPGRR